MRKAYAYIPREAMWMALRKLGVPDKGISLVKSFHQDMSAMVRLEWMNMEGISVQNGLTQGCCMAPMLFNLYTCLVMERWMARVDRPRELVSPSSI